MKRAIALDGIGKELVLSKATEISEELRPEYEFIHLDKLKNGTWRIVYTASTIPDFKELQALRIVREE
jgi:hypothetical protein